jgi:hypothetical protein
LALTVALFTTSALAQSPSNKASSTDKAIAAAQEPRAGNPENKAAAAEPSSGSAENKAAADKPSADKPKGDDLKDEIDAVKAENAAVRELLRKMEEQQKTLLEQVDACRNVLMELDNGCVDHGKTLVAPQRQTPRCRRRIMR